MGGNVLGQRSYVCDLAASWREGLDAQLEFVVKGAERDVGFVNGLSSVFRVTPLQACTWEKDFDVVLLDGLSWADYPWSTEARLLRVVHNARRKVPEAEAERVDWFLCMTPVSAARYSEHVPARQIRLVRQGVSMKRFAFRPAKLRTPLRALFLGRTQGPGKEGVETALESVAGIPWVQVSVVGGTRPDHERRGWHHRISWMQPVSHQRVPEVLLEFDVVFGSGRSVLEAMASGKPTFVVGRDYGGLVTASNLLDKSQDNFTGLRVSRPLGLLPCDLLASGQVDLGAVRQVVEWHFDSRLTAEAILSLVE